MKVVARVTACGALLAVVLAAAGCGRADQATPHRPDTEAEVARIDAPVVPGPTPVPPRAVQGNALPRGRPPGPFAHLPTTRQGLPLDGDPYGASSIEDQRWLDRNGYPNAEQWRVYSNAEEGLLRLAADAGDRTAQVFLDARLLAQNDADAVDRLLAAGARGSAFALSMLQAWMIGSSAGDPEFGHAISRVMEMKGDSGIALVRDMAFAVPLTAEQQLRADALALQLFERLRREGNHRSFVDPRPFEDRVEVAAGH